MASDAPSSRSGAPIEAWQPLIRDVEVILHELQTLAQTFGPGLDQLATVDWRTLAQRGYLTSPPRLIIERTIDDARAVLTSGQRVLTETLQQVRDPDILARQDKLDIPERLRAAIRLYTDTPNDIRNRCQRLTTWLHAISQAQQQAGEAPLTAHLPWPQSL